MRRPIYEIDNLSVTFDSKRVLMIKEFSIHRGACYVVFGKNASGKSVFIDLLARNQKNKNGTIKFEGKNLKEYRSREFFDLIAVVPQVFYPPWGSVKKYLQKTIGRYSHNKNIDSKVEAISKKMQLNNIINKKMKKLTPGQLRWVVLAASIAADTKVLFIDEFELHLTKNQINDLIRILNRKINYDGVSLIATTLSKDILSKLASVTITLDEGKISSVRSSSNRNKRKNKR